MHDTGNLANVSMLVFFFLFYNNISMLVLKVELASFSQNCYTQQYYNCICLLQVTTSNHFVPDFKYAIDVHHNSNNSLKRNGNSRKRVSKMTKLHRTPSRFYIIIHKLLYLKKKHINHPCQYLFLFFTIF